MPASDTPGKALPATNASGATDLAAVSGADVLLTMPLGVLALAPDGTVAVLNPAAEAMWGVPAATVLGHAPAQVQPAVLPLELLQALAQEPGASPDATYWLPHTQQWIGMRTAPAADGRRWVYWDKVTADKPANSTGQQQLLINLPAASGNHEYQLAQDALHEAEERYRTLFEAMAQGFCVVEVLFDDAQARDYRFLVTNPAFEQQTGLYNVVGQTMRTLRPEHEPHWFELYGQIALTGESQRFDQVAEQLGRFYEVYAFRVGNPREHKVAILFSDVSEARRTEEALRAAEASYRVLFNSIDEGYFLCDVLLDKQDVPVDILYRDANPAAMRMVGADYRGRRLHEIDPAYEGYWVEIFGRVAQTGVAIRLERYAEPDQRWYDFYVLRVGDATSLRVAVVFQDITERKRREAHAAFLATVQDDLSRLATPDEILQAMGAKLGNYLHLRACDFCDIDETQEQNLRVSNAWTRPGALVPPGSCHIQDFWSEEIVRAGRAGETIVVRDTATDERLEGEANRAYDVRAWVGVPFHRYGQWTNLLTVSAAEPRDWQPDEIALLSEVVQRLVPRVERARAEETLRQSEERQAFLVQLGDALRPLLDAKQVQAVAARLLGQHLHANQAHYGETQGDDVVISQGYGDGLPAMKGRFRSVDFGERLTATHRAGIVQVIHDIETDAANTEAERQVLRQARIGAYITVPLVKEGQWVATLAVHSLLPRPWTVSDVQLVEDVAERTWAAVERARAEEARRESEEKYRAIFNSINEGFSLLDIQYDEHGEAEDIIIRDANPAQDRIDGVRALIGKRVREFLPDLELKWIQRYARVAQSGEPAHFEDWSEANQRWYEVDASRVGEAGSTLVAIVYNDITERRQHEQALRESEARIAADLAGMHRLYELQAKLAHQTDVKAAFQDVLALACEFTGTDRGCVQFLSDDGKRLEMFVWQGYADDGPFISFFRYEGLEAGCEVTRVQRQRLIIEDTMTFEGLVGTDAGAASDADDIRAAQSTPMTSRLNETIGVISTQFRQPHRPSEHELQLMDMLAWTAAEFLERHRAEAALRASEQEFRLMADAVPQIVWLTDAEGRVTFFNQQWSDYTGVPYEPTTAAEVAASFVHPDDGAATMAAFTEARATGTTFLVEHRIRSKAGDYRWFLVRAEPYRDLTSGEIIRWFGASVDIHDRKQVEEALRESEAKYRTLFNSIDEGYYLLEVMFDEHGEATDVLYLDANPASVRMSGGDRRGKRLREVGNYEAYWYELYGRVARTGVSERTERFSSTAGIWVDTYTFKVGEEGNRVATVFQDVTERKRREANQAFLAELTNEFTRAATVDDIMQNVGAKIGSYMKVVSVVFTDVDETQGQVTVSHGWVETGALSIVGNTYRLTDYVTPEFQRLSRAGEVFVVSDTQTDPRTRVPTAWQIQALVAVPFHRDGEWRHYLTAYDTQARHWRADEIELFRELANHIFPRLERARAEEALHASEALFQKAFSISTVGQLFFTLDGAMTAANPAFVRMSGYRREALLTLNWEVLTAPEFWDITTVAAGGLADHGETAPYEKQFVRPDGARWWGLCAPIRLNGHGPATECMAFVIDITERKQAEEMVQQSEARQAYLLTLSDALRRVPDAAQMQATAVHTAMEYFQADRCYYCEIAGDTVTIRRDAARPGLPSVAAVYSLGTMPIFQAVLQERQPVVVADVHTSAVMDDNLKELCLGFGIIAHINVPVIRNGEQVGMLCLCQGTPREWTALEIALVQETAERTWAAVERARAEEALRESEALLQKAFSIDTVGQLYFTLDGGMTAANQAFVRMSGCSQEALLTTNWEVLTAPEFWDITIIHAGELADRGETTPYEKQMVRPDGSRWWALCAPTRLKGEGPTAQCMEFIVDISERKQAEEQLRAFTASLEQQVAERTQALRENQELMQSVFDTSLISMSVLQAVRDEAGAILDFRIAMTNKELEKETGRPDLVGKLYAQEYPGIRATGIFDLMLGVMDSGAPATLEYYYGHEGLNKWYACQFVKRDDGLVATNLDITERMLAEEKSREQAHFIARVNETLPDLMTVTELATGQVLYVNRNLDEAPGFEREKLLNIPQQEQASLLRMHPDDAALLPDYLARAAALADHEMATYSYRAKLNTDQWRSFQVRGSVFQRDPATGAATQVLSVAQDVTAQKEAEHQQAKAYQLLQQSEEVASLGSWDYDRSTGEFLWSAGMYRLFGLPLGSPIRPETYLDFVVAEDRAVAERIVRGLTTGRTGFEETLRIQAKGTVKTVRVKAAGAFDAAGEPLRMLGVDLDISEVKRLEADNLHLRLTQQQALFRAVLEAQETERHRMSESLHNGLGQTLYATKLQLNHLKLTPVPAALHRADQLLADAIRQTRTLSHELVPTVLNEFGLSAALHDICRSLRGSLRFECTVELDAQQPLPQPQQVAVYRMAQELAQNVVKHARATEASLALETVPGFVLLRVEDNGVGFANPPVPGTGIGLRTIRDRVALLGGTVDLGSSPEFGTYVRIRFPLPNSTTLSA